MIYDSLDFEEYQYLPDDDDYEPLTGNEDPCDHCGPSCHHWWGDGLCGLAIAQQAGDHERYFEVFKPISTVCSTCGKTLMLYYVPADDLWQWPGEIDPLIGLEIYGAYDVPKGILCAHGRMFHVWIGTPDNQRIISCIGKARVADYTGINRE